MVLAARGTRQDGGSPEPIADERLSGALKRQGSRVQLTTFVTATIVTGLTWLLPL